jgi:hypothetical protein
MATRVTAALAAAIKSKAAVAVVTTVVAVGAVGGGTVAAAASGAFGQQVKAKVESCKDALANGTHGIGECVSDFAQQHGVQQRQQHSQGQSTSHGQSGTTHGKSDQTHGKSGQHGGPPTATPEAGNGHGKP